MTSVACSGRHVAADAADDDGQLALVVQVRWSAAGRRSGRPGRSTRGVGLEEHQRLGRHLPAHLGGVRGVVLADADDLAARDDRARAGVTSLSACSSSSSLEPDVERVAGQRHDHRVVGRLAELVDLPGDDAEARLLARGEPTDTHAARLSNSPRKHGGREVSPLVRDLPAHAVRPCSPVARPSRRGAAGAWRTSWLAPRPCREGPRASRTSPNSDSGVRRADQAAPARTGLDAPQPAPGRQPGGSVSSTASDTKPQISLSTTEVRRLTTVTDAHSDDISVMALSTIRSVP